MYMYNWEKLQSSFKPYVKSQTYGNINVPLIYTFGSNSGRLLRSAEKTIPKKL